MDKSVDELLEDLKSQNEDVRKRSVLVLAKYNETRVIEALIALQDDGSTAVRYFAKKAIRDFESGKVAPTSDFGAGTEDIEIPEIESEDPFSTSGQVVIKKSEIIPEKDSISNLLQNLKSDDLKLKLETIKKFGDNKEVMAVDPLLELINSSVRDIRVYSVQSLGQIGEQRILTPLLNLLNSEEDCFVIATLVKGIARVGGVQLIPILARYLKHPDGRTRANTVESLEIIGDPKIIKFLVPLLQDPSGRVKANAVKVLSKFGKSNMLQHLEEMLKSEDDNERGSAIFALSKIGGEGVVVLLTGALKDQKEVNVINAIDGLIKLGTDEAKEKIKTCFDSTSIKIKNYAKKTLGVTIEEEAFNVESVISSVPKVEVVVEKSKVADLSISNPISSVKKSSDLQDFQAMWGELNTLLQNFQDKNPTFGKKDMAKMLTVVVKTLDEN
jgi:HEAT repeat protein